MHNDNGSLSCAPSGVNPEFCAAAARLIQRLVRAGLVSTPQRSLTDGEIRAIKQHEVYARRNRHRAKRPRGARPALW